MNLLLPSDLNKLCLSYLSNDESMYYIGEWDKINKNEVCNLAAKYGWMDLLVWARKNNYPWSNWTSANAAENGHLDVLKWMRKNGCPWNTWVCSEAAENGHLDVLIWAYENGCPSDMLVCDNAAKNGHLDVLKWACENIYPSMKWKYERMLHTYL